MNHVTEIMKGFYLNGQGGFEKLEYREDIPIPKLDQEDEVLIKVYASSVNNTDINTRIGWYSKENRLGNNSTTASAGIKKLSKSDGSWEGQQIKFPRIQGIDACGKIINVGSKVSNKRIGERVLINPCMKINSKYVFFGSEIDGAFAEYTKVKSEFAYKIDSNYSSEELASFPCSYSTAENMLIKTSLKKNENILITGASGGVGSACIQLAKRRGANIIAISTHSKFDRLNKIGASQTISYDQLKLLDNQSIDVVIDLLGGNYSNELMNKLKHFGRYVTAGAVTGPFAEIDIRTIYLKDLSLYGSTVLEKNVFRNLISYIENKEITPLIEKKFSLKNLIEAQRFFLEKKYLGKIVITVC